MKTVDEYIVPWVRGADSYSDKHLEFAWQHPEITRLMSNENPLPPSEGVLDAVVKAASLGNLYPDTGPLLRQKLADKAGLTAANVVLGNGSTDVINFILEAFVAPSEEVIISVPTFPMYETRTRINGGVPVLVPMRDGFGWDIQAMLDAVNESTKLIFVCTPNNPTGNTLEESALRRLLDTGVPVFIDEAYFELAKEPKTYAYLIHEYPNALINRTFSKAYGLAGLRLGYVLADEKVVGYLNRMKIPWNVNLVVLFAALAALEDEEHLQNNRKVVISGRETLCQQINQIPGFHAYESEGNFVLIDASVLGRPSIEIVNKMITLGVFVRPMSGHHLDGFIRVTIGSPEQNRLFMEKLNECIISLRAPAA